jgi:retron-type reverse transcriptase
MEALMLSDIGKEICTFRNLYDAMRLCKRGVIWKDSVAGYVVNGLVRIHRLKKSLENDKYDISPYTEFKVYEPKERDILSTKIKDRVFQRSFVDNYFYDEMTRSFIYDNGACQKGRGTERTRKRLICHMQRFYRKHGLTGYTLKGDLSNFFGSTKHEVAYAAVNKRVSDEWARRESKRIIDSFNNGPDPEIGMGLGSQCTQIIQLAVLDKFDHYVKEVLRIKHYVRYNDDFILIHEDKGYLRYCLSGIDNWMTSRGLKLNPKKTQIANFSQGVKFLGFRFRPTETGKVVMTLLPEKVSHERRKLKRMRDGVRQDRLIKSDVDRSYESFKANLTNNGKHKSEHPGRRARRSCHGLELAMDAFYKDLWRDDECSDLRRSSIS